MLRKQLYSRGGKAKKQHALKSWSVQLPSCWVLLLSMLVSPHSDFLGTQLGLSCTHPLLTPHTALELLPIPRGQQAWAGRGQHQFFTSGSQKQKAARKVSPNGKTGRYEDGIVWDRQVKLCARTEIQKYFTAEGRWFHPLCSKLHSESDLFNLHSREFNNGDVTEPY